MFGNPLNLIDSHYRWIFFSQNKHFLLPSDYGSRERREHIPFSLLSSLNNEKHIQMHNLKDPYIMEGPFDYQSLCINRFEDDEYFATLYLDDIMKPFTDKDKILLKYLASIVKNTIRIKYSNGNFSRTQKIKSLSKQIIHGEPVEQLEMISCLQKAGWEVSDHFMCFVAESKEKGYSEPVIDMIGEKVCSTDQSLLSFTLNDRLVISADLDFSSGSFEGYAEEYGRMLADYHMTVGISPVFNDYFQLIFGYQAGSFAISQGSQQNSSASVFRFDELIPEYIKAQCTRSIPADMLSSGPLRRFIDTSRKNSDGHLNILKVYLRNNMNIAQTSRDLYMHRNTLLYRLNRINEELGLDLDDPNVRLQIMVSLFLQDEW